MRSDVGGRWQFFKPFLVTVFLSFVTSGCTWIKPIQGADQVELVTVQDIISCQKIGAVNTSVLSKVGFIERSSESVTENSIALAKNEAVRMGGNRIVAVEPAEDGHMRFNIYLCK
ncbi:DUF4156 domain-containing protein [Thiomicrorhabdus xiamenensis]|uniref:DUF4156 domain-containing protein n=1 Tax=Thiomicrorhabdus xiamenensis TaxID=2739063 RepID=A0A7D4SYS1_9GAMM|nr:DUF4156 domain-containing protein [Thiomicrorhabdus xiamenensis]QKI89304.1 DUF4156 domain-containing protein [Thiomicrorhabdus xiamenensis]